MTRYRLYIALIVLLVVFATAARLFDLRADPPAYFAGGTQDIATDGAYLTLHARNAILTGEWNPFGYEHWAEFKISLISGVAYLTFKLAGISLVTANLAGVILNLVALMLMVVALWRLCSPRAVLFITLFLATDYLLWLFGRLPFSENSVLFFAASIFFVYAYWFERIWGKVLIGTLVACCGLFGKSFGFLILAGPLMYVAVDKVSRNWRSLVAIFAPIAIGIYLYTALVSGKSGLLAFVWQHAAGEHGYPYGLLSPIKYFEKLISFANSGLFTFAPVPGILAFLYLTQALMAPPDRSRAGSKVVHFMTGWLVIWLILISPFNYLPVRYLFVLLVPICVLAGLGLDQLGSAAVRIPKRLAWWRWVGLLFLNWILIYYVAVFPFLTWKPDYEFLRQTWYALPLGVVLLAAEWWFLRGREIAISAGVRNAAIVLAVIATLVVNGRQYYEWYWTRTYTVAGAASDMSKLLGPSAVLAGQYGPVLAFDSRLESFPLFLGSDAASFVSLLSRYPVTHLAVSEDDWNRATKGDEELQACPIVARYWLRDKIVCVVRINDKFGNAQAEKYARSELEIARDFCAAGQGDSCFSYLERFLRANPACQTAMVERYHMTVNPKDLWPSRGIVDSLVAASPTDMTIRVLASVYYRSLFEHTSIPAFQDSAETNLNQALRYSPKNEKGIRDACTNARPEQRIF